MEAVLVEQLDDVVAVVQAAGGVGVEGHVPLGVLANHLAGYGTGDFGVANLHIGQVRVAHQRGLALGPSRISIDGPGLRAAPPFSTAAGGCRSGRPSRSGRSTRHRECPPASRFRMPARASRTNIRAVRYQNRSCRRLAAACVRAWAPSAGAGVFFVPSFHPNLSGPPGKAANRERPPALAGGGGRLIQWQCP